ncbi:Nasopharyngeal colonization factor [Streptococcus pneumoniae]|nr:hypothetical protein SPV_2461 [Streptococcus pneumoniae]
MNRNLERCYLF